jgi:plastocyanin
MGRTITCLMLPALRPRPSAVVAVALLALSLVACAASDTPFETQTVTITPAPEFDPADITIPVGTTVIWSNTDGVAHSIQFLDGELPTDPLMVEPGNTFEFTFQEAGLIHYQCGTHPDEMTGTITVTPADLPSDPNT